MVSPDSRSHFEFCPSQISRVDGLAIDNEVVGIPQVQCSEDAVTFAVRTRNAFTGNIYIKGKFNEPSCRQEFFSNTFNGASYTVRIPLCGMRRIRQVSRAYLNALLPAKSALLFSCNRKG